ncbi:hypothetical protein [Streptomyces luteocolor]|uniref:hypothetical protein n=1 Tax=Streptomyces luteocolor TaxID=285500 RepID=UPI000852FE41|nr:hypothetical protein [Streptomyces luteocolor]
MLIRGADGGEAGVYINDGSITVDRFTPGKVLDIVAELAERLDAVILLQDGIALLTQASNREDLPTELQPDAVTISPNGPAIHDVIASHCPVRRH